MLTAVVAVLSIAACAEKVEGGASCPLLCPEQAVTLRDTTIDAVSFDTTVAGLPSIGAERYLMLASNGDSLDTRVIVRFDTIPQHFTGGGTTDSVITRIDSATLVTPILKPDSAHRPKNPVTLEVYDVDSTAADPTSLATDTVSSVLATLFRPGRLIGSKTFAPESLLDTLRIPLSTDTVLDRVLNGKKLRVGFRLVTASAYDIRIGSTQSSTPVTLRIKASRDTAAKPVNVTPLSNTPTGQDFLSGPLADYSIVVKGGAAVQAGVIGVGGVPSRRSYLRFNLPSRIIDSTTVIRATLILTQRPNRLVAPRDSLYVFPSAVLAASSISDVRTLLQFVGYSGEFGLDSVRVAPADSGQRTFQMVGLVRSWRGASTDLAPRSIAMRSSGESAAPGEVDFFSSKAPAGLRPRLRITYAPQASYGLP